MESTWELTVPLPHSLGVRSEQSTSEPDAAASDNERVQYEPNYCHKAEALRSIMRVREGLWRPTTHPVCRQEVPSATGPLHVDDCASADDKGRDGEDEQDALVP
jgi:hypothetical protein